MAAQTAVAARTKWQGVPPDASLCARRNHRVETACYQVDYQQRNGEPSVERSAQRDVRHPLAHQRVEREVQAYVRANAICGNAQLAGDEQCPKDVLVVGHNKDATSVVSVLLGKQPSAMLKVFLRVRGLVLN